MYIYVCIISMYIYIMVEMQLHQGYPGALTERLPHPDDPALGVTIAHLVDQKKVSVAIDDRDLNHFAMNPSCNATFMRTSLSKRRLSEYEF